jgi:hypothetical protein
LWVLILFFAVRGGFSFARKDESKAIKASIKDMASSQDKKRAVELNAVSFAEGFTRAFVEYDGDEAEHRNNLNKYISSDTRLVSSTAKTVILKVTPVKSEWLGDKKILVDCVARVMCVEKTDVVSPTPIQSVSTKPGKSKAPKSKSTPAADTGTKVNEICLRVPVSIKSDGFVIENMPTFVAITSKSGQQSEVEEGGERIEDDGIRDITKSFITAYCRGDKTEISYYMLPESKKIEGLGNNFTFGEINTFELRKKDNKYFINVTYLVDSPVGSYLQGMQIIMVNKDKRYLVESLNTVIK